MNFGLQSKTQKLSVPRERGQWRASLRRGWRSNQGAGTARCVVMGRSLDFLPVAAGSAMGFTLDSSMRPICILKRQVKSESHMENGLELGDEVGRLHQWPIATTCFTQGWSRKIQRIHLRDIYKEQKEFTRHLSRQNHMNKIQRRMVGLWKLQCG